MKLALIILSFMFLASGCANKKAALAPNSEAEFQDSRNIRIQSFTERYLGKSPLQILKEFGQPILKSQNVEFVYNFDEEGKPKYALAEEKWEYRLKSNDEPVAFYFKSGIVVKVEL